MRVNLRIMISFLLDNKKSRANYQAYSLTNFKEHLVRLKTTLPHYSKY